MPLAAKARNFGLGHCGQLGGRLPCRPVRPHSARRTPRRSRFPAVTFISTIHLSAGAPAYTFDIGPLMEIDGTSIEINNSLNRLTLSNSGPGGTFFVNASTAGVAVINNTSTGFTESRGYEHKLALRSSPTVPARPRFSLKRALLGPRRSPPTRARSRSLTMRARPATPPLSPTLAGPLSSKTRRRAARRNSSPTLAASSIFPSCLPPERRPARSRGRETTFSARKLSPSARTISAPTSAESSPMEGLAAGRAARLSKWVRAR